MKARISVVAPRLDSKPWGGRRLERYGIDLPAEVPVGEALVTAGEAVVTAGYGAGATLDAIVALDPAAHLGSIASPVAEVGGRFPLLVKLIDAASNLSIQVHPNDQQAAPLGRLGKTEAWHVLHADPGANLYLGIRPGVSLEEFRTAATRLDGSSADLMRTMPARPGTTVLIPAGTIHALGAGVMVYEVQQPSDVTYRLDDWGRLDASGNPRETHLDAGFGVARAEAIPEPIVPVSLRAAAGERHLLAACRYFALERVELPAQGSIDIVHPATPTVITLLHGSAVAGRLDLANGASVVIWPSLSGTSVRVTAPTTMLVAYVPDLRTDIAEPALRTGAAKAEIAALAGATGDLAFVVA